MITCFFRKDTLFDGYAFWFNEFSKKFQFLSGILLVFLSLIFKYFLVLLLQEKEGNKELNPF